MKDYSNLSEKGFRMLNSVVIPQQIGTWLPDWLEVNEFFTLLQTGELFIGERPKDVDPPPH